METRIQIELVIHKRGTSTRNSSDKRKLLVDNFVLDTLHTSSDDPKTFWRTLKPCAPNTTTLNSVGKGHWYQHFYNVFNSFFDHESNVLDEDEDENVRRSDENDENERNDTETLECDITEAEVYEAIRILNIFF